MSFTAFNPTKPVITDPVGENTRQNTIDYIRYNFVALAYALVFTGFLPGYNYSYAIGTGAWSPTKYTPQYRYLKNGTVWARATLTWNASGYVTQAVLELSGDSGSNWDSMGTITLSWDGDGVLTSTTWS